MVGKKEINAKHNPSISVILPTYNSERYVLDSLKSLLFQSYQDYEIIIVDDGSKDKTCRMMKDFIFRLDKKDRAKFHLFEQTHKGISVSRNFGISQAKGDIISVLDSDDILLKSALSDINSYFRKNAKTDVAFGDILVIDDFGQTLYSRQYKSYSDKKFLDKIFWSFQVPFKHSSMSFRRKSLEEIGGYNESYQRLVDVELMCRILSSNISRKSFEIGHINKLLVQYRQNPGSISNSRFVQLKYWFRLIDKYASRQPVNSLLKSLRFVYELSKGLIHQALYSFQKMRRCFHRF